MSSMPAMSSVPLPASGSLGLEMNLASGSALGFHPREAFKRKERWARGRRVTRSAKAAQWQTSDAESFRGHIKEMSCDHNGCRTLQQALDNNPQKVVRMIYEEVGDDLTSLMMDAFGNYLFQKLLDVSSPEQRRSVVGARRGAQRSCAA